MKLSPHRPAVPPDLDHLRLAVIYDDLLTGLSGCRFANFLAEELGGTWHPEEAMWRCDMLISEALEPKVIHELDEAEVLVLAFAGNHEITPVLKEWLQHWLAQRGEGRAAIFALFDPGRTTAEIVEHSLDYLKAFARNSGIDFYSYHLPTRGGEAEAERFALN